MGPAKSFGSPQRPAGVRAVAFGKPPLYRVAGLIERAANPKGALVSALYGELLRLSGEN